MKAKFDIDVIYEENVSINPHVVQVFGYNKDDEEIVVEFSPYQGIKVTTEDCISSDPFPNWFINDDQLIEVTNSAWLSAKTSVE